MIRKLQSYVKWKSRGRLSCESLWGVVQWGRYDQHLVLSSQSSFGCSTFHSSVWWPCSGWLPSNSQSGYGNLCVISRHKVQGKKTGSLPAPSCVWGSYLILGKKIHFPKASRRIFFISPYPELMTCPVLNQSLAKGIRVP